MIDVLDAFAESLALRNEQGHKLCLIGGTLREFGEVHVLVEQLLCKLLNVDDLCHRADGEASKVRIEDDGLCVGVANHADARRAALKSVERRLELGAEVRALQIVDGACKSFFLTVHRHTATAGSEM